MLTWNAEKVENFKEKNEARPGFFDGLVWAALWGWMVAKTR